MSVTDFVEEPFVNHIGQELKPGDPVVFVGSSWSRTSVRKGMFAGVRKGDVHKSRRVLDENGEPVFNETSSGYKYPKYETYSEYDVVALTIKDVERGYKYEMIDGKYQKTDEMLYGVSTLPLKRAYKIDTKFVDMHF